MSIVAGVGYSNKVGTAEAAAEACQQAMTTARLEEAHLAIVFASVDYDQELLLRTVRDCSGASQLWGGSAAGVIANERTDESLHAVSVMVIASDRLRFEVASASGLAADSGEVGRRIGVDLKDKLSEDALFLLVMADGLTVNFDRFAQGLGDTLAPPDFLPLLGGSASEPLRAERTFQYLNGEVLRDSVSAVLVSGDAELVSGVTHGSCPLGATRTITQAHGNVIETIDGRRAWDVFQEYLSPAERDDWTLAALNLSIAFDVPGAEEVSVRLVQSKDEQSGALTVPCEVQPGMAIRMARRDAYLIASGIDALAVEMRERLAEKAPALVLHFDCVGRGQAAFLDHQRQTLHEILRREVAPLAPWVGLYTYGEIGPIDNTNRFHNYTAVIAALY